MELASPSPSRTCEKCGATAPDEAAWCPECGNRLPSGEPPKVALSDPEPTSSAKVQEKPVEHAPTAPPPTEPSSGPVSEAMGDAADNDKPPPLPRGTIIDNKYAILRVLGEGGMGIVYLAEDVHTGVEVVLKAVRPELAHRKDVVSRTLAEGRTLARIDHPNVVHLNAIVADASGLWLVMQYIQGESLDQTIKRYKDQGRAVSFTIAVDIFRQVLQGVAAAHREGIIHRDLKPGNVLVRQKDGVAKVTDFGIAKPEEQARVGQGNTKGVIGSLWYMSPEQVQGRRDLDKRVDIYALGIMLFELLTSRVPFNAESSYEIMRLHVEEPLPKVVRSRADVQPWVDEILARACAKKREDRFSSCEEFLATIDGHLALATRSGAHPVVGVNRALEDANVAPTESGASTGPRSTMVDEPRSRWWMLIIAIVAIATVGGAYGAYRYAIYQPPKKKPKAAATAEPSADALPNEPATSSTSAQAAPVDPFTSLPGKWRSEAGTDFEAVLVGDRVEFRVVDPAQLKPADYVKDEPRFTLKRGSDPNTFLVEEKMRPQAKIPFDPRSRATCQEIWTAVDGKPLVATFSGTDLAIDFAKISVAQSNLTIENGKIVGCSQLRGTARGRGRTLLKRV
ncbi:MAG: protein kinase [Polyangiaceae bacterium]|nr:protein kinase [Polyangiaceae bacterium]